MHIIVKKYEHFNRAMGKYIRSKKHYYEEMAKGGYVPSDEGHSLAAAKSKEQKWKPSDKCIDVCREAMTMGDRDGNITLAHHPRLVREMEKTGMTFKLPDWLPKHYQDIKAGGAFKDDRS